ncbi:hypothetical protein RDV89_02555 [Nocardioides zeae]|uniref:Uncharacterized protein n=1 Tax=Nocardioides imazamoxiresistens TaxID=3231893 RepID=A0ABU3PRS4_9ACTN|nr:hypothetical protein [Nocardioides zeae]MDT9591932.1 hypothetical protein [Nocardioides zeae]
MTTDERPADAQLWLRRQTAGETHPFADLGVTFLEPGGTPSQLLDTSYLTDDDRANPDVMANVRAIEETAALVTWVAVEPQRAVGYWRGPASIPLDRAPLAQLDDEGQLRLTGAVSVTEFYAAELEELLVDDDVLLEEHGLLDEDGDLDDDALRAWILRTLREAGYEGAEPRSIYDWKRPEVDVDPEDFHEQRYRDRG